MTNNKLKKKYTKLERLFAFLVEPIAVTLSLLLQYGIAWCMDEPICNNVRYLGVIFVFLCVFNYIYSLIKIGFPQIAQNKLIDSVRVIIIFGTATYPIILFFFRILLPYILSPFICLYLLYYTYIALFILEIITLLMLVSYWAFRKYSIHPIMRMMSIIIGELFPIIGITGSILMLINGDELFKSGWDDGIILDSLITSIIAYIPLVFLIFIDNRKLYAFVPFRKYILYLRSFTEISQINLEPDLSEKLPIVEVAEPTSHNSRIIFQGYDFYLPTKNWKPQLRYYISRAKFVICSIGITEGVQWEMFENNPNLSKYIFISYHIESVELDSINLRYRNHELFSVIQEAKKRYETGAACFCYCDKYWYFSRNLNIILECLNKSDFIGCGTPYESNLSLKVKTWNNTKNSWLLIDILRHLWMLIRPQSLAKMFATPVAIALFALTWLFPIFMILSGTFFLVCIGLNYMGFDISLDVDISLGAAIFGIVLGLYLLREARE